MKNLIIIILMALLAPSKVHAQALLIQAYLEFEQCKQQLKQIKELTSILGSMHSTIDQTNDKITAQAFRETGTVDLNGQRVILKDKIEELAGSIKSAEEIAAKLKFVDASFRETVGAKYEPQENEKGQLVNFSDQYETWSKSSKSVLERTLANVATDQEDFKSERRMLDKLMNAAQGSDGRMKALEAANQLSLAYTDQLQSLRDLVQSQIQVQSAAYQRIQEKKDLQKNMSQRLRMRQKATVVGNGEKI